MEQNILDWSRSVHAGGSVSSARALAAKRVEGHGAAAPQQGPDVVHRHVLLLRPPAQPRHRGHHRDRQREKVYEEVAAPVATLGGVPICVRVVRFVLVVLLPLRRRGLLPQWELSYRGGLGGVGLGSSLCYLAVRVRRERPDTV